MEDNAITPAMVNNVKNYPVEDITKLSESVIEATQITNQANEELDHLSDCLSDFAVTQEKYQKKSKTVRNQMRYLASHM